MATKSKIPTEEKFDKQDFDIFEALTAIDKKDYKYFDRLSEEQQKKFSNYMMVHWVSCVNASAEIEQFYVMSVDAAANTHMFNENVMKHPKLQWLMLCASSPGLGKQFHQWIPQLKNKVAQLKEPATVKDTSEYFKKIYKTSDENCKELAKTFVIEQNKKVYLAKKFPEMKHTDIETLTNLISETDIEQYERDQGN
jgi:hypothetical protein